MKPDKRIIPSNRRNKQGRFSKSDKVKDIPAYKVAEYEIYANFLSLIKQDRIANYGFDTDQAFCKKFNVDTKTLWNWCQKPEFWELVNKHIYPQFKKYKSTIIASMTSGAIKKQDASLFKLWLEVIDGFVPKSEIKLTEGITLETILSAIPNLKLRAKLKYKMLKKLYPDQVPDDV